MIDEFLKEVEELKTYKEKYEQAKADKIRMSEKLYELMMYKYNNESYEQRSEDYKKYNCGCCRYHDGCEFELPENIEKPCRENDSDWIPATISCKHFEWN